MKATVYLKAQPTEPKNLAVVPVVPSLFHACKIPDTTLESSIEPGLCLSGSARAGTRVWRAMVSRIKQTPSVRLLLPLALALLACFGMFLLPRAQATQQIWILPGAAETTG